MAVGRKIFSRFLPAAKNFHSPSITEIPAAPSQIHGVHIFQCPDVVGIVAKLSECIAARGASIHGVDVFVPESKHVFYSRSEFVFDPARWPRDVMENDFMNIGKLFKSERSVVRLPDLDPKYKIAILASKQVLSTRFLEGYGKDIINIHHGLLPSFKGSNPAKQAYMAGVKLIGATTHFVTPELDAGPIIEQMVERVSHRDTLDIFVQKSENLEKQCLRKAIKSYCELRVLPYEGNKTVVF